MSTNFIDHEREARQLLDRFHPSDDNESDQLAAAQAHATLALVEAVRALKDAFDPTTPGAFGYSVAQAAEVVMDSR